MSPLSPHDSRDNSRLRATAEPYSRLACLYDTLLGRGFFAELQRAFEWIARRYSIHFASAADVACGTGTLVHYLCRRGVPVVYGVDRSPQMLSLAIAKNQAAGAHFLLQDFATLQLPHPVDLLTCHFDALNYLLTSSDLLRALRRFRASIKPGGHLIFDMMIGRPPWPALRTRVERVSSSGATVQRLTRWDSRDDIQTAEIFIFWNGRLHRETHVQRRYPAAMIVKLLAQARLALRGAHDFQTLGRILSCTSRAIYVAQAV